MYPQITIGSVQIASFSLMLVVAFLVATMFASRQARFLNFSPMIVWGLLPWAAVAGLAGAQLYSVIINIATGDDIMTAFANRGQVFYGGLIAGTAVAAWRFRRAGLPLVWMFDYGAPCVAIAHAIGRIGCFLVGDDYGLPTSLPWGVAFPNGAPPSTAQYLRSMGAHVNADIPAATVLAVHPVQLYEAAVLTVLAAWLWRASRRPHQPYAVVAVYAMAYGSWRFVIEFWRPKNDQLLGVLTSAQCISIGLALIGLFLYAKYRANPLAERPTVRE
jgi:phosphatidylglycerol---prolipoprotein diacylglyceryl transferase